MRSRRAWWPQVSPLAEFYGRQLPPPLLQTKKPARQQALAHWLLELHGQSILRFVGAVHEAACAGVGAMIEVMTGIETAAAIPAVRIKRLRDMPSRWVGLETGALRSLNCSSWSSASQTISSGTNEPASFSIKRRSWGTVRFPSQFFQTRAAV